MGGWGWAFDLGLTLSSPLAPGARVAARAGVHPGLIPGSLGRRPGQGCCLLEAPSQQEGTHLSPCFPRTPCSASLRPVFRGVLRVCPPVLTGPCTAGGPRLIKCADEQRVSRDKHLPFQVPMRVAGQVYGVCFPGVGLPPPCKSHIFKFAWSPILIVSEGESDCVFCPPNPVFGYFSKSV